MAVFIKGLQPHASRTTVGLSGRARAGPRKTASLFPRSETSGLVGIRERPWSYSLGDAGQGHAYSCTRYKRLDSQIFRRETL